MKWNFKTVLLALSCILSSGFCFATDVRFVGSGSFEINGATITTTFSRLQNYSSNIQSGSLYLQLVASPDNNPAGSVYELSDKFDLGTINGIDGTLLPGAAYTDIYFTTNYHVPPFGNYYVFLVVYEYPGLSTFLDSAPATANPHTLGNGSTSSSSTSSGSTSSGSTSSSSSSGGSSSGGNDIALACPCRYQYSDGRVTIEAERVSNNRPGGYSGTLKLKLYATTAPYFGGAISGYVLGQVTLNQLEGHHYYDKISSERNLSTPPPGTYYLTLVLTEFRDGEDLIMDYAVMEGTQTFGAVSSSSSGSSSGNSASGSSSSSSSSSGMPAPSPNPDHSSGGGGATGLTLCLLLAILGLARRKYF
ncbi:hypothetical protein P886_0946 [Alteromonadaceae bacterium 2753L.S.0a.02]|nr:hypothetical protein P886_0946 [Alteromonadaceae bacterium 2753L.S.0a.02]